MTENLKTQQNKETDSTVEIVPEPAEETKELSDIKMREGEENELQEEVCCCLFPQLSMTGFIPHDRTDQFKHEPGIDTGVKFYSVPWEPTSVSCRLMSET